MEYITIPGQPISKKRPRFARRGNHVVTYNDQMTEESRFLFEFQKRWLNKPLKGPVCVELVFYMKRPKSHYGTGKNGNIKKKSAPVYHTKKPDIDNLKKFVFDALNQSAWEDDSQIYKVFARKAYSKEPRTEIIIQEM